MSAPHAGARASGRGSGSPSSDRADARPIPTLLVTSAGVPLRLPWVPKERDIERLLDRVEAAGHELLSLDDLLAALRRPIPDRGVVLGFLDAGPAFLDRVWPTLETRGISPALFVHTAAVGQRSHSRVPTRFSGRTLSWNELGDLAQRGAQVESAGHFGIAAHGMPPEVAFSDLVRSCREIENRLGHTPRAVLLHRSRGDGDVQDLAQRAGFQAAFHAQSSPPYASPWALGFVEVRRWGGAGRPWSRLAASATLRDR